jgi:predicted enzyme related to lactoylglutathione lyase
MPLMTKYRHGVPCWIDASTQDMPKAIGFYSELFGWTAQDNGAAYGHYNTFRKDGKSVAGIMTAQSPNQPSAWCAYIASDDIDKTAALIADAGGHVVMPPMDVTKLGKMMLATDPAGAFFGVWQAQDHLGSELVNEEGAPVWHECQSREIDACKEFYSRVFGWTYDSTSNPGYTMAQVDGRPVAGMISMDGPEWGQIPSNWMTYIQTEDVDAIAAKAAQLGGKVLVPPTDMSAGRFCVIGDSEHAVIAVINSAAIDDPNTGWTN